MIRTTAPITGPSVPASAPVVPVATRPAPAVEETAPAALAGVSPASALSSGFLVVLQALGEACAMAGVAPAPRERR